MTTPTSGPVPLPVDRRIDQACDAFEAAWQQARSAGGRPRIEDYLPDPSDAERATLLWELLLVELDYRQGRGDVPATADYLQRFPAEAEVIQAAFACAATSSRQNRAPLTTPDSVGATGPYTPRNDNRSTAATAAAAPLAIGSVFGDYELLDVLARGGMGVVYRARQRGVHRLVALKLIRRDRLNELSPDQQQTWRQRFREEVHTAARLTHPHLVTVYDGGEIDGQPFYAMRLIEGQSLADVVRQGPVPNARAATLLEVVARAVHSAHEARVLHRDLKPGNILLDQADQPFVADFGLAKRLDGDADMTRSGDWLGTPPYMSPEQATDAKQVTVRSDVYGLGAILYELLTGRPPFRAADVLETLRQVREEDPVPPRRLNPAIDRDLETISLTCLRKEPARRYASAEALADDLRRFREGRPIQARPVSPPERLWRWCRRRPLVASLLALLSLAAVAGVTGVTWQWRRADGEWHRAEEHRRREEENFRQARRAVDDFARQAGEKLRDLPGAQQARQSLLQTVLDYYQAFLRERAQDPSIQSDVAEAYFQLANVVSEIGSKEEALDLYQQALALQESLAGDHPTDASYRNRLAAICNNLATLQEQLGQRTESHRLHKRALTLREQLVHDHPDDKRYQRNLAGTCNNLSSLESPATALDLLQRAIDLREHLLRQGPSDPELQSELAETYNNIGEVHRLAGRPKEALSYYQKAANLLDPLVRTNPTHLTYQRDLAQVWNNFGTVRHRGETPPDALPHYQKAHDLRARLVRENPTVIAYHRDLANSCRNLGVLLRELGQWDETVAMSRQACEILEKLLPDQPDDVRLHADLAGHYRNLGGVYREKKQFADAIRSYQQACAIGERLVARHPASTGLRGELASNYLNLGGLYIVSDQPAEAIRPCQQARDLREKLVQEHPNDPAARNDLVRSLANLEKALANAGRREEAIEVLQQAIFHQQKLGADQVDVLSGLASLWGRCAVLTGKDADRQRYADQAMEALQQARSKGFRDVDKLKKDAIFEPLRSREDFQKMLREMQQTEKK